MVDLGTIVQLALAAVAIAGLALTLRWLGGEDGVTLADLFRIPVDPPRPRGVQEAEPPRWHVDRLGRPRIAESRGTGAPAPRPAIDGPARTRLPSTD